MNTCRVGIIAGSFSNMDEFAGHDQSQDMTSSAALVCTECKFSIHTSGCEADLTPLPQLRVPTESSAHDMVP